MKKKTAKKAAKTKAKKSATKATTVTSSPCTSDSLEHSPVLDYPDDNDVVNITNKTVVNGNVTFDVDIKRGVSGVDLRHFGFRATRVDPLGNITPFKVQLTLRTASDLRTGKLTLCPGVIPPEELRLLSDEIVITILTRKRKS
jgi:hypothetical protein